MLRARTVPPEAAESQPALVSESFACPWVDVVGDVDSVAAHRLAQTLRTAQETGRTVVLDLRRVSSLYNDGVGVILRAAEAAASVGGRLTLVSAPEHVRRALMLAGFDAQIPVIDLPPVIGARRNGS